MKIEIKNVKFYESMSQETNCFVCDIYVEGKKVGYAKNEGHGGNTNYYPYDGMSKLAEANAYCKTLPKVVVTESFSYDMDLETMIDNLFEKWLTNHYEKKAEKQIAKNSLKGICYGDSLNYQIISWKGHTIETLLKHPKGKETIKAAILEIQSQGHKILNKNIDDLL